MAKEFIERNLSERSAQDRDNEISLLAVANVLLRSRRLVAILACAGAIIGLALALLSPRVYTASAKFIPGGSENTPKGLALAASEFGINIPSASGGWGPAVYAELLRSRALLEPLVLDSVVIAEESDRRESIAKLLGINEKNPARKVDLGVRSLAQLIRAEQVPELGAVSLSVTTKWPSVSLTLADKLIRGVGTFNVQRRRSQAAAERQFVDAQAAESETALRAAENALQDFLQRNREFGGSPQLVFERDRLQREVSLRQQVYTSLLQNREEARIREVRDTPVITVLEDPRLPVIPEPRKALLKTILGALAGFLLATIIALFRFGFSDAQGARNPDAREFVRLLSDVVPRMHRRKEVSPPTVTR